LAICASMYAVYHGPAGLKQIATRANNHARVIASSLVAGGFTLASDTFFDTVVVNVENADAIISKAVEAGINLRKVGETQVGISTDETTTSAVVKTLLEVFGVQLSAPEGFELPEAMVRTSDFMTHPIFNSISSETQMMRYLRRLSDRDLALDRTM
ncbi:hypothetical protein BZG21_31950, partial [Escherichia coli]|nr:hypothetical protein [Escherichia coli]